MRDSPSPLADGVGSGSIGFVDVPASAGSSGLSEKEEVGVSAVLDRSLVDSTEVRFATCSSETGVVAFLFPRSRLVSEVLLKSEADVLCSL